MTSFVFSYKEIIVNYLIDKDRKNQFKTMVDVNENAIKKEQTRN